MDTQAAIMELSRPDAQAGINRSDDAGSTILAENSRHLGDVRGQGWCHNRGI